METWEIGHGLAAAGLFLAGIGGIDLSWGRGLTGAVLAAVGYMIVWGA